MLLWVMEEFENTWIVSGKKNSTRVIPRLYGSMYKTLQLSPLAVKHSIVVMATACQPRKSQIESYG